MCVSVKDTGRLISMSIPPASNSSPFLKARQCHRNTETQLLYMHRQAEAAQYLHLTINIYILFVLFICDDM